jgi:hypothetical protein
MKRLYGHLTMKDATRAIQGNTIAGAVSKDYLAFQFGLLPTIADLRDFAQLFAKWGLYYGEKGDLLTAVHSHKCQPKERLAGSKWHHRGKASIDGSDIPIEISIAEPHSVQHGTAKYYFVCPELTGVLNRMCQLTDLLGVLDPAAIWDKIPFSFVIDWFIPVGHWLHANLKPQLFPADCVICDYCESIGSKSIVSVRAHYASPQRPDNGALDVASWHSLYHGSYLRYARRAFPLSDIPPAKRGFQLNDTIVSIKRIFIGAALVGSGGVVSGRKSTTNRKAGKRPRAK